MLLQALQTTHFSVLTEGCLEVAAVSLANDILSWNIVCWANPGCWSRYPNPMYTRYFSRNHVQQGGQNEGKGEPPQIRAPEYFIVVQKLMWIPVQGKKLASFQTQEVYYKYRVKYSSASLP
ncbi:hypothetical protein BaRGS_00030506 [Batillaria attramentaria]|uniref:Uncharacterized protein n=1 Tax=Batillaria attramentaria TaxID=370345 RepID=A0ABD0JTM2_9CAEN